MLTETHRITAYAPADFSLLSTLSCQAQKMRRAEPRKHLSQRLTYCLWVQLHRMRGREGIIHMVSNCDFTEREGISVNKTNGFLDLPDY